MRYIFHLDLLMRQRISFRLYFYMCQQGQKYNKKATIKLIAKVAGLSFSTVAKALRDDPVVKSDTKKRILKIAEKLNYYPNSIAKALRSRKSKTIGII
ncbi:MAG TPA: LacI family DNA-binding transcriptional regulator, partial [Desulfatiglandales bacterium]|nr:LacI family DNA-binding transcriptional regulator [Desulfatiglandales bacterium]